GSLWAPCGDKSFDAAGFASCCGPLACTLPTGARPRGSTPRSPRTPTGHYKGDDHLVVRAGVRALLDAECDLEVLDAADTGERGIDLTRNLLPDVVVADLLLPDIDGVTVTERIRHELPEPKVLILSSVAEEEVAVTRAVRTGASGYVLKMRKSACSFGQSA